MVEHVDILSLVERIYEAATNPERWQMALDALTGCYAGGRGTILHHDVKLGTGTFPIVSNSWDRVWVDHYNAYFASVNPWLKHLKKRPVGLAVPAEFMLDRQSFIKTEFYHDFMRPQDMLSAVGVTINQDRDRFIAVSVMFSKQTADKEQENVALLQRLAPHLQRALQVNRQLARGNLESSAAATGLDQLAAGIVIVDGLGRSLYHNRSAERIFAGNDGLALDRDGAIKASASSDTAALHASIGEVSWLGTNAAGSVQSSGRTFRIGRPSGSAAFAVMIAPIRARVDIVGCDGATAILIIKDPGMPSITSEVLSVTFGVTHAEARVLRLLMEGRTIAEAGEILNISLLTARTHVKNMFAKMGCTRQAELVRAILQHPIWMIEKG